jgi:hypothetical protein
MNLDVEAAEMKEVLLNIVKESGGSCTIRVLGLMYRSRFGEINLKVSIESNSSKIETNSSIYSGLRFEDIHRTPQELQGCIRSVYR